MSVRKKPTVVTDRERPKTWPQVIFGADIPADPECPTRFDITALWRLAFSLENKRPYDFLRLDSTAVMGADLAVAFRGAKGPMKVGIIPTLESLESLGMVRTTKGATGATYVDGHLLIDYARYIDDKFGILVMRGFELWMHQQAGQEAPEAWVGPATSQVTGSVTGGVQRGPGNVSRIDEVSAIWTGRSLALRRTPEGQVEEESGPDRSTGRRGPFEGAGQARSACRGADA